MAPDDCGPSKVADNSQTLTDHVTNDNMIRPNTAVPVSPHTVNVSEQSSCISEATAVTGLNPDKYIYDLDL